MLKEFLNEHGLKSLFTKNSKIKKSANSSVEVYNWTIPALKTKDGFKTCPNAGKCAIGCYAQMGAYVWSNVSKVHHSKFNATRHPGFVPAAVTELVNLERKAAKRSKQLYIRIHDAGDFYSKDYALNWFRIIRQCPNVEFYAYTKQVELFKELDVPNNLTIIYSYGGRQDKLINPELDRHSAVFENETDLLKAGYINASKNDLLALTDNPKVGLVYHGNKSYNNTAWNRV